MPYLKSFEDEISKFCSGMNSEKCVDVNGYPDKNPVFLEVYKKIPEKGEF